MSPDNIAIAREIYKAFNERRVEDHLDLMAPELEWHQHSGFPEARVFRGRDDWYENLVRRQFVETFPDIVVEPEELIESVDHVVAIGTAHGRGPSGMPIEIRFVHVIRFRDGKAVWVYDCAGVSRSL